MQNSSNHSEPGTEQDTEQDADRIERTRNWLRQGVLPVVVISSVKQGLEIAEGLCAGGITQIEITLRTTAALQAMGDIAKRFPEMRLSAGTVLTAEQFDQSADQGSTLFISPGLTEALAAHALKKGYAWVPGVATALGVGAGVALDMAQLYTQGAAAGGPTRTEVLITTTLKSQDRYLAGSADMYYIEQADAVLYLPELPPVAPVPTPVKTWRVVAP